MNTKKIRSINRFVTLFVLLICNVVFAFGQGDKDYEVLSFNMSNSKFEGITNVSKDIQLKISEVNTDRVKVDVFVKGKKYKADQKIVDFLINGDDDQFQKTITSAIGVPNDSCISLIGVDYLKYLSIVNNYILDSETVTNLINDFKGRECAQKSDIYMKMVGDLTMILSASRKSYIISIDKYDAVDIRIKFSYLNAKREIVDTTSNEITLYRKKYWSTSISTGIFFSGNKESNYSWKSYNMNDTIFNLDNSGLYKISQSDDNKLIGIGINALSHLIYHHSPNFGIGVHFGLGTLLTNGTEKMMPQLQYGLTFELLKESRWLINLGGNLARVNRDLSTAVSNSSVYSLAAIDKIDLPKQITKAYASSGFSISVSYQIL